MGERSRRGLGRPARAAPGARYARRPLAGAPPRDPGLSPLRGPGPAGRILYKDGLRPNPLRPPRRLRLAFGQSRRRPVHGSMGKCTASRQPPRRGRNASARESPEPYRECFRVDTRSTPCAFQERRPRAALLFGRSPVPTCWERPQPEWNPQLVYLWGVTVVCGYWQGTPEGYRLKFRPAGPGPRSGLKPGSRGGAPASGRRA